MGETPARPPRPDEEDLLRFHNGDTLDNIPVVRLPEHTAAPPQPAGLSWWKVGALGLGVAALGALATVGALQLAAGDGRSGPPAAARTPDAPDAAAAEQDASTATPSPTPTASGPSGSDSPAITSASGVEQVRVIQAPATGGDVATTYCLVYTGSEDDGQKEAVLLADAPAYQCGDLLSYDPVHGSLHDTVPVCEPPSRAAMLVFDPSSSWGDSLFFACLTQHHGA